MVKARKAAVFSTDKLKLFEEAYIKRRLSGSTPSSELLEKYGKYAALSDEEDDLFGSDHWSVSILSTANETELNFDRGKVWQHESQLGNTLLFFVDIL